MQRVSNTLLTFALTAFVTAVSLALMAAAWLMATHLLGGPTRALPRWLFIGLLALSLTPATAQTTPSRTLVVVAERTTPALGRATVSYALVVLPDTLPPPVVQTATAARQPRIAPEPAWPAEGNPLAEGRRVVSVADRRNGFYTINITREPPRFADGFRQHP